MKSLLATGLVTLLVLSACGRSNVRKTPDGLPDIPDPHRAGDGAPTVVDNAAD